MARPRRSRSAPGSSSDGARTLSHASAHRLPLVYMDLVREDVPVRPGLVVDALRQPPDLVMRPEELRRGLFGDQTHELRQNPPPFRWLESRPLSDEQGIQGGIRVADSGQYASLKILRQRWAGIEQAAPPEVVERYPTRLNLRPDRGPVECLYPGPDAHRGQHCRDRLRHLLVLRVAVHGRCQFHVHAVRVAGGREQLLGLRRIIRIPRLEIGIVRISSRADWTVETSGLPQ